MNNSMVENKCNENQACNVARGIGELISGVYNMDKVGEFLVATNGVVSGSNILKILTNGQLHVNDLDIFIPRSSDERLRELFMHIFPNAEISKIPRDQEYIPTVNKEFISTVWYLKHRKRSVFRGRTITVSVLPINIIMLNVDTREGVIDNIVKTFDFDFLKNALWREREDVYGEEDVCCGWKLAVHDINSVLNKTHVFSEEDELNYNFLDRYNKYTDRGFHILGHNRNSRDTRVRRVIQSDNEPSSGDENEERMVRGFHRIYINKTCPICFDEMESDCCVTTCGHCFHEACISRWTQSTGKCPICRKKLE